LKSSIIKIPPNAGNTVRYDYAGKAGTILKSSSPNAGNFAGGGKGYAGKAGAISKSLTINAFNAVRYNYASKTGTTSKSFVSNAGNTIRYGYACMSVFCYLQK